jgi:hypothetical protein
MRAAAAQVTRGLGGALVWPGLPRKLDRWNPGLSRVARELPAIHRFTRRLGHAALEIAEQTYREIINDKNHPLCKRACTGTN